MKVVNMACGLANRMFQYCYYCFLKKQGMEVKVDAYDSGVLAHERVEWNKVFPHAYLNQAGKALVFCLGGGNNLLARFRRRYASWTTRVIQMPTAFDAYVSQGMSGDRYIIGTYQNAEMVESVRDEALQAFEFAPFDDDHNKSLAEEINRCEAVAIHVRKGMDYQSRIWYQHTCPLSYYHEAIHYICQHVKHPKFYVFTDNKEWVAENFVDFEYTLVEGNPAAGWGSHWDMQLMSMCKHNIISNSTYSWWAAFLNRHHGKIVVLPKQWFNPSSCDESTSEKLQCKEWIAI